MIDTLVIIYCDTNTWNINGCTIKANAINNKIDNENFRLRSLSIDSANSPHSIDFDLNYQLTDLSIIMIFQNCMHI